MKYLEGANMNRKRINFSIYITLSVLLLFSYGCGDKTFGNAYILYCNKGGVIVDFGDPDNFQEIILGVPDSPLKSRKLTVCVCLLYTSPSPRDRG